MFGLGMEKILFKLILVILFLLGIAWVTINIYESLTFTDRTEKSILSILKSKDLSFLVTDKLTSQICVEISENNSENEKEY